MWTSLLLLALASPAHAACDAADLGPSLEDTERAFVDGDMLAAHQATVRARKAVGCAREPLAPELVARVHRATALSRWLLEDDRGVERSFRGMLHADPRLPLPVDLVPAEHPIQLDRMAAEEAVVSWHPSLNKPSLVDGVRFGAVPVDQHYLVQRLKGDAVVRSKLHTSLPLGKRIKVIMVDHHQSSRPARRLWYAGLGSAAVSLGLYSGAVVSRLRYNGANGGSDPDRADRLFRTTNALSIGASVAALTSIGTFTAGEIIRGRDRRRGR